MFNIWSKIKNQDKKNLPKNIYKDQNLKSRLTTKNKKNKKVINK